MLLFFWWIDTGKGERRERVSVRVRPKSSEAATREEGLKEGLKLRLTDTFAPVTGRRAY